MVKTFTITLDNVSDQAITVPVDCSFVQLVEQAIDNPLTRFTLKQPTAADSAYPIGVGATGQLDAPFNGPTGTTYARAGSIIGYAKLLDVASATFICRAG